MFVVVIGNVFDGLDLIGPFDEMDEAQDYGDASRHDEWTAVELVAPPLPVGAVLESPWVEHVGCCGTGLQDDECSVVLAVLSETEADQAFDARLVAAAERAIATLNKLYEESK